MKHFNIGLGLLALSLFASTHAQSEDAKPHKSAEKYYITALRCSSADPLETLGAMLNVQIYWASVFGSDDAALDYLKKIGEKNSNKRELSASRCKKLLPKHKTAFVKATGSATVSVTASKKEN